MSSVPPLSWRPGKGALVVSMVVGLLAIIAFIPWWGSRPWLGLVVAISGFGMPVAIDVFSERKYRVRKAYLDARAIPVSDRVLRGLHHPPWSRGPETLRYFSAFVVVFVYIPILLLLEGERLDGSEFLVVLMLQVMVVTFWAASWAVSPWFRVRWCLSLASSCPRSLRERFLLQALAHDPELYDANILKDTHGQGRA